MEKQVNRVGKRKSAVARVYLRNRAGTDGTIKINGRDYKEYFPRVLHQRLVEQPLEVTSTLGQFDLIVNCQGGGLSGQAGAVRHGISRALETQDNELRTVLKRAGYLTRDARKVERKKYGLAGARKSYQFSKR